MKSLNKLKLNKFKQERSSYFWNMCSGVLNSMQSVVWLMLITRIMGIEEAGIFTISYAVANLMLSLGKFGMRNFQVSDINGKYRFKEYVRSRILSVLLMIIISLIYVWSMYLFQDYTIYKMQVVFSMCLLKSLDAIEDVFYGMYQQKGRLDLAGKVMSIRLFLTMLCFIVVLFITRNLVIALNQTILFSIIVLFIGIRITIYNLRESENNLLVGIPDKTALLLKDCIPLCIYAFLSFFVCNIPKYTIDIFLDEKKQAYFGFISMPVFVISLLGNIIFQPVLLKVSIAWKKPERKEFLKLIVKEIIIITSISLGMVFISSAIGIQVLEFLYDIPLMAYQADFTILMIGGIFLSLSVFLSTVLTVIRLQKYIMYSYLVLSILAIIITPLVVQRFELRGASIVYMLLELTITLLFCIKLLIEVKK